MKLQNRFSIRNLTVYLLVLSLGFVCVGCSSKTDEEKKEEKAPPSAAPSEYMQIPSEEEAEQLKQEDDELKGAMTEVIGEKEQIASQSSDDKKEQKEKRYEDEDTIDSIIAHFDLVVSAEEKIKLIKLLSELSIRQDPSMISFVQKALDSPYPEVGRAAIGLLEDYDTPDILPVIEQALNSGDEQTGMEALSCLSGVNDPQAGELLAQALSDTSIDIRVAALKAVEWHEDDRIKLSVMGEGIASEYDDVKYEVASMLEDRSDHSAVDILIEGLKDNDPDFREEVNASLDFLIDKEFGTYQEAQAWWNANKDNYDEELFPKED